jgi:hypothetical protein
MFSIDGGASWIWWIVGGVVVWALIGSRGGGSGAKYFHVPDGENWRGVYRRKVLDKDKDAPAPASKLMFGLGLGLAAVALLLVYFKPF